MTAGTRRATRFRPTELLSADAHAETWRGVDDELERAVTIVFPSPGASASDLTRFADRAVGASRVSHPHLAVVYEVAYEGGRPFAVTEILEGRTLNNTPALPPRDAARVVDALASALDALHAAGVAHGGVRVEHVLIDGEGRPKLGPPVFGHPDASASDDLAALGGLASQLRPDLTDVWLAGRATTPSQIADAFRRAAVGSEVTEPIAVMRSAATPMPRARMALGSPIPEPSPRIAAYVAIFAIVAAMLVLILGAGPSRAQPVQAAGASVQATRTTAAPPGLSGTPDVAGKTGLEAGRILIEAGFASPVRWFVEPGAKGPACTVERQEPAAGTAYQRGSTAVLYVTQGC